MKIWEQETKVSGGKSGEKYYSSEKYYKGQART